MIKNLDNPYLTIIKMCELKVMEKVTTVYEVLSDMLEQLRSSDIDNPIADERINNAREFVVNNFSPESVDDNNIHVQMNIVLSMKKNLK